MRTCDVFVATVNGRELAAVVTLDGGKVEVTPVNGHGLLARRVAVSPVWTRGGTIQPTDAENWFDALPLHYKGSRMWASMRGEGVAKAGSGLLVSFTIPPDIASDIAVPGGERPEDMHVTLCYMGKDWDESKLPLLEDALRRFASEWAPVSGEVAGPIRFAACENTEGRDVCVASFENPRVQEFRAALKAAVESAGFGVK